MDRYFGDHRHKELRQQVRAFAEREIRPRIPDMETSRSVSRGLSHLDDRDHRRVRHARVTVPESGGPAEIEVNFAA
jgi:hypothetical protein